LWITSFILYLFEEGRQNRGQRREEEKEKKKKKRKEEKKTRITS